METFAMSYIFYVHFPSKPKRKFPCVVILSPLYLRQELCLEDASGLQRLRDLSSEEEAALGQVDQNLPDDLT